MQAFVGRLECHANAADPRGYVGDFRPIEFAAAMGMPPADAVRIFAALKHKDIAWIDQDHVVTFYGRNPDQIDATAPERDRRRKARRWLEKDLARRHEAGWIDTEQLDGLVAWIEDLPDPELFALRDKLRKGVALEAALSTGTGHAVADRGTVASHARAKLILAQKLGDDSGDIARGTTAGLSEEGVSGTEGDSQAHARLWIELEGKRLAIERMPHEQPGRVETLLQRWCDQDLNGDAVGLMTVLIECGRLNVLGSNFFIEVTSGIGRYRRQKLAEQDKQHKLPLRGLVAVDKSRTG